MLEIRDLMILLRLHRVVMFMFVVVYLLFVYLGEGIKVDY